MIKQAIILEGMEVVHVFDFENLQNEPAFKTTLANMKSAAALKRKVKYILGYSNYTFD